MHLGGVGGGGVNTNAYKCVQGGRGGLNMVKNTHLYAGLLKMLQYVKHLRLDNTPSEAVSCSSRFWTVQNVVFVIFIST